MAQISLLPASMVTVLMNAANVGLWQCEFLLPSSVLLSSRPELTCSRPNSPLPRRCPLAVGYAGQLQHLADGNDAQLPREVGLVLDAAPRRRGCRRWTLRKAQYNSHAATSFT